MKKSVGYGNRSLVAGYSASPLWPVYTVPALALDNKGCSNEFIYDRNLTNLEAIGQQPEGALY